jgi:plasmid stabilization system protein ParE
MSSKITISSRAKKDIEISYDWYEKAVKGLGIRFVLTIQEELNVISLSPGAFIQHTNGYRQKPINNFQFIIIYKITGKAAIRIVRIFHTSRNPKFKYKGKK